MHLQKNRVLFRLVRRFTYHALRIQAGEENKKTPLFSSGVRSVPRSENGYGLKRNFSLPRLAASLALRRTF
jgi:hypothetical protein